MTGEGQPMRMIDSHVHLVDDESFRHTLEIERSAGAVKVIVSCLNPSDGIYKTNPEQFREDNARVYQWMRKERGFVEGWAYINPEYPEESLDEIERAVNEYNMVGIKLECGCVCTDARYGAIMEKADSLNLPVLQHTWFKITGCIPGESTPLDVASMARDFPQVRIIMAHMGGDWQRGIKAVRDLPNVSVDISGSIIDYGMVEEGVAELGAERILFGTDLPDIDLWTSLGKVMGSEISCRDREMILYENAARLMGANAE